MNKPTSQQVLDLQIACTTADGLPGVEDFQRWLDAVLASQTQRFAISIRLVDEAESQALNAQYRGKDYPTNVLSFPFEIPEGIPEEAFGDEGLPLGDLVICAPVVRREAAEQGKPEAHHWAHLCIHGTLHLLGYDHIDDHEAEEMEALEVQRLAQLGIANPYLSETEQAS